MCVCNNSLKPYHGEISGRRYGVEHYRSSTCITSFLPLVSQNGCRGAQQEGCCLNSISVHPCVYVCFFLLSLFHSFAGRPCGPTASVSARCCFFFPPFSSCCCCCFPSLQSSGLVSTDASMRAGGHARARSGDRGCGVVCVCVRTHVE